MKISNTPLWQRIFRTRAEDSLPHIVTHQRVYIVPTRRGWAFLFAVLLMLIASINYALSLGYALSFLLIGLFAATLLHTYRNLAGLTVRQADAQSTFAGKGLPFSVTLENERTQTRHGIQLSTTQGARVQARLDEESNTTVVLKVPTVKRGICKLGRLTLQSDWPLGLWTSWSYLHIPLEGVVYPTPEDHPPPLPVQAHEHQGEQPRQALQGDVSGLRDYIPGDSIGSIAWKSAARGTGLQVRTFDAAQGPSQALLNLQNTGIMPLEKQLSRLCAWVLQAESVGTDYALQLADENLEIAHGQAHRQRALKALALHGRTA